MNQVYIVERTKYINGELQFRTTEEKAYTSESLARSLLSEFWSKRSGKQIKWCNRFGALDISPNSHYEFNIKLIAVISDSVNGKRETVDNCQWV